MSKKSFKKALARSPYFYVPSGSGMKKALVYRTKKGNNFKTFDPESSTFWEDLEKDQARLQGKIPQNLEMEMSIPSPIESNTILKGTICSVDNDSIIMNVGKSDAFVDRSEFSDEDSLEIGTEYPIYFDGVNFSYLKGKREMHKQNLIQAGQTKEPIFFEAKVMELIHGGYWMQSNGVKCFMPGSLASVVRLTDFSSIVGETIKVCAVGIERGQIILSHRDYLKRFSILRSQEYQKGQAIQVEVTGVSNSGYFVEIEENVFGMLPKGNVNRKDRYEVGDQIEALVMDHDNRGRLILTQKPIDILEKGMILTGKITKFKGNFAFVELIEGVTGTIFKTDLKYAKEGQLIEVVIKEIKTVHNKNYSYKKIHLKVR